jgi:hypothetical protein
VGAAPWCACRLPASALTGIIRVLRNAVECQNGTASLEEQQHKVDPSYQGAF